MINIIYPIEGKLPCEVKDAKAYGELDPHKEERIKNVNTSNDLTPIIFDDRKPDQVVKIREQLPLMIKHQLVAILK